MGRASVIELPRAEVERRGNATAPQWPIMSVVLHGVTRDQLMGRHKTNRIQVAYGNDAASADTAMHAKAAAFHALGIEVSFSGV